MKKTITIDMQTAISSGLSLSDWAFLENVTFLQNNETGYCYAKKTNLAKYIGITTRGLRKLIDRLASKGLLKENKNGHLKTTNKWFKMQNIEGELSSYLEGNSVPVEGELSSDSTIKKENKDNKLLEGIETNEFGYKILLDVIAYRRSIKKPFKTSLGVSRFLNDLREIGKHGYDLEEVVFYMKQKEWQTISIDYLKNSNIQPKQPKMIMSAGVTPSVRT
jgi:predicted transcriptional regulator